MCAIENKNIKKFSLKVIAKKEHKKLNWLNSIII